MAKPGRKPKSSDKESGANVSAYFRRVFRERPDLLSGSSNSALFDRWLKDNPGEKEVPTRIKQSLFNVKSVLRKKGRMKRAAKQPAQALAVVPASPRTPNQRLESLEERIDESLTMARTLDREGLADVIKLLRRARNEVVWKMGQ
ncbi:MAG TPA: hypothetical protein VG013_08920 [Gemmataceae bacterium]|jgi:hypothetical protein|nr:hypothetical protein [Gemmataceae bacterium]